MSDALIALAPAEGKAAMAALEACRPAPAAKAAPVALNLDRLLHGIESDTRYARAAAALPSIVAHLSLADPSAPQVSLRLHMQRAAELRDWIEDGTPMVTA
jgi:hypothetical protein